MVEKYSEMNSLICNEQTLFFTKKKKKILEMFVHVEYFLPAKGTILLCEVVLEEYVNCTMHLKEWLKILDFC